MASIFFDENAEDANDDGLIDLMLQVETEGLDESQIEKGWAVLTGETFGGQVIEGRDEVRIVPREE